MTVLRSLWSRIAHPFRRHAPPEPPARYDPDHDPAIRALRLQRRLSERATRRMLRGTGNPLVDQAFPTPRKGRRS